MYTASRPSSVVVVRSLFVRRRRPSRPVVAVVVLSVSTSRRPSHCRRPSSVRPSRRDPSCPVVAVVVLCPSRRSPRRRRSSSVRPSTSVRRRRPSSVPDPSSAGGQMASQRCTYSLCSVMLTTSSIFATLFNGFKMDAKFALNSAQKSRKSGSKPILWKSALNWLKSDCSRSRATRSCSGFIFCRFRWLSSMIFGFASYVGAGAMAFADAADVSGSGDNFGIDDGKGPSGPKEALGNVPTTGADGVCDALPASVGSACVALRMGADSGCVSTWSQSMPSWISIGRNVGAMFAAAAD